MLRATSATALDETYVDLQVINWQSGAETLLSARFRPERRLGLAALPPGFSEPFESFRVDF